MKRTACLKSPGTIDEDAWEKLLDRLEECTPQLELESPGTAYLEAAGMDGLYGDWAAWSAAVLAAADACGFPEAQLGIATGYLAARLAAQYCPNETRWHRVIETDRAYLSRFSLDVLPLNDEPRRRMTLLGITTLGQLARLSARAVAEQFGPDVLSQYRLACGAEGAPRAIRQMRQVETSCMFDPGASSQDELFLALLGRTQPLWDALRHEGRSIRHITLRVAGWHWRDERSSEVLANLAGEPDLPGTLRALLSGLKMVRAVEEADITLQGVLPFAVRQPMLWTTREAQNELDALAGRLRRRCPAGVLRGEPLKTWAPLAGERYGLAPWSGL
ncbi:MAG: hypothetical protein ACYC6L_05580 [Anaerolineae bacterium]